MDNCDMCGTKIVDGSCSCGEWVSKDEMKDHPFKKAIEYFDDMKRFTITMDAPHLGCCAVFFRGDYLNAKQVEQFIYEMKGRPYYE